jgi:osmotically-inducible protein OsmY
MIDDRQLQQDVLDELDFEPSIDAAHIGVTAHHGVVTLSGFVGSYGEKFAAERAAQRVKGVRAIAEEIDVRLPSDKKHADDEIAARAADILKWQVGLPAEAIRVKVENGVITLSGTVEWQFQKQDAAAAVHKLTGIVYVSNQIQVASRVCKEAVKDSIERALERSAELEASRLTIETDGGKVTLRGRLGSWHEREVARRATWSVPGVTQVHDQTVIEA